MAPAISNASKMRATGLAISEVMLKKTPVVGDVYSAWTSRQDRINKAIFRREHEQMRQEVTRLSTFAQENREILESQEELIQREFGRVMSLICRGNLSHAEIEDAIQTMSDINRDTTYAPELVGNNELLGSRLAGRLRNAPGKFGLVLAGNDQYRPDKDAITIWQPGDDPLMIQMTPRNLERLLKQQKPHTSEPVFDFTNDVVALCKSPETGTERKTFGLLQRIFSPRAKTETPRTVPKRAASKASPKRKVAARKLATIEVMPGSYFRTRQDGTVDYSTAELVTAVCVNAAFSDDEFRRRSVPLDDDFTGGDATVLGSDGVPHCPSQIRRTQSRDRKHFLQIRAKRDSNWCSDYIGTIQSTKLFVFVSSSGNQLYRLNVCSRNDSEIDHANPLVSIPCQPQSVQFSRDNTRLGLLAHFPNRKRGVFQVAESKQILCQKPEWTAFETTGNQFAFSQDGNCFVIWCWGGVNNEIAIGNMVDKRVVNLSQLDLRPGPALGSGYLGLEQIWISNSGRQLLTYQGGGKGRLGNPPNHWLRHWLLVAVSKDETVPDWKVAKNSLTPRAEAEVEFDCDSVYAGDRCTLTVSVTNRGKDHLYRIKGKVDLDDELNTNLELFFGAIAPGKAVNRRIPLKIDSRNSNSILHATASFTEFNNYAPANQTASVNVRCLPRDDIHGKVQLLDTDTDGDSLAVGNGNGILEGGEAIDVVVSLQNKGKTEVLVACCRIELTAPNDAIFFPSNPLVFLPFKLSPGKSCELRMHFGVRPVSRESEAQFRLRVFGETDEVLFEQQWTEQVYPAPNE